jgi:hypothetical protein
MLHGGMFAPRRFLVEVKLSKSKSKSGSKSDFETFFNQHSKAENQTADFDIDFDLEKSNSKSICILSSWSDLLQKEENHGNDQNRKNPLP